MPSRSNKDATDAPTRRRSPPPHRIASGELLFVRLETPRTIPSYPSYRDRLAGTDTWSHISLDHVPFPSAGSSRYTTSADTDASSDRAESVARTSYSETSLASPSSRHRRYSTGSPSETLTWCEKQARRTAAAEAVREAVSNDTLDANSYTDGQLYAVKVEAEKHCTLPPRGEGDYEEATHSRKRRRTSGLEGREGQIAHALKVRRLEALPHDEGDSENAPAGQVEEVEVDLTKLLGM
ncbi:hypothetical protein JCM10295v2_005757 [Rhodotorula toruloides]